MENQLPRRKPLPKLKFPLMGDTFLPSTGSDVDRKAFMILIAAMVIFIFAYEYFTVSKGDLVIRKQSAIEAMEWKGKVSKKYMGYDKPDIHMFEIIDDTKTKRIIDISIDKSKFFETLMPRDSVYKSKGNKNVRIKNYTREITIPLQFAN